VGWDFTGMHSHAFQYAFGAKADTKSDMLQILPQPFSYRYSIALRGLHILFFKTSFFISKILCLSYIISMVIENVVELTLPVT